MKIRLLRWLVCPICHGELRPVIAGSEMEDLPEADRRDRERAAHIATPGEEAERDITRGALTCHKCRVYYPVINGIPRMLTYPIYLTTIFERKDKRWIDENLKGFSLPRNIAPAREQSILRNFSTEWTGYKWKGSSFWGMTPETRLKARQYELGTSRHGLKDKLVLEIGIGMGADAHLLSGAEGCEIIGIDLGYGVDAARYYFGRDRLFHIVQASLFSPPFREGTFDAVYSHGVLHHTYSTRRAFGSIAGLPKPNGGMLYVWLFSHEHDARRVMAIMERVMRPLLWRMTASLQTLFILPLVPLYILRQNIYRRRSRAGEEGLTKYGWNEALHAARDRFTPPFSHRQSYEEVAGWFREEGYDGLELLRDEPIPAGVPPEYALNVGIRGFRYLMTDRQEIRKREKMNILMICDYLGEDVEGGSDRILFEYSRLLNKRGHILKILAGSDRRYLQNHLFSNGIEICRYRVCKNRFIRFFQTLAGSRRGFDRLYRDYEFDVINFYQPLSAFYILLWLKDRERIRKVYTFNSPWHKEYEIEIGSLQDPFSRINSYLRRRLEKFCLEKCDTIIVLSEYMKSELKKIHGIDDGRIVMIPGGVDIEKFSLSPSKREARKALLLPDDRTIILTIRSLSRRKGLSELILAAKPILEKLDSAMLVIVGEGPRESELKDLIRRLNLESRVLITGFKEDAIIPLYYRAADLFVIPTQVLEGFGLVILEAMSSGVPVLATPVGGIPEILTDFDRRCLSDGTSSTSLQEGLNRFLGDMEMARSIAGRSRDYVMSRYSWEVIIPRLEEWFRSSRPVSPAAP